MFPPLRKPTLPSRWLLLLWALLAIGHLPALAATRDAYDDPAPPPPEPNPLEVEVPRGGPVQITLSAYSITSPIIRFRIRRLPKGKLLGPPRMVTAGAAVVRYQPPAGAGPGDDSFDIAVQSTTGVSAPAEVRIRITDKAPLFVAPLDLDFGDVLPGQSASRTLDLQNIGGGVAEGAVQLPDGWSIAGNGSYRLLAGAKQSFTVVFTPTGQRAYTGDVAYTGNPERATDLEGECVPPLAVTTGTVVLQPAGSMRTGLIHVVNHTDGPRAIRLTPGAHVQVTPSADVPAMGAADIPISASGDRAILDQVMVEGDGLKANVLVLAAAPPPSISAASTPVPATPPTPPAPPATPDPTAAGNPAPLTLPDDGAFSTMTLPSLPDTQAFPAPEAMSVAALSIARVGETDALVFCDFKGSAQPHSYRVETETVGLDPQGRPGPLWTPFAGATIRTNGSMVVASLKNLRPGAMCVVRLVGLDDQGNIVATSSSEGVWTLAPAPPWWRHWEWIAAVAAGAAGAWWLRRRRG